MRLPRRGRDQRGTAVVEFCWLTVLLLVPLVYLVLAVFDAQRAAFAAQEAARAADRAAVVGAGPGSPRQRAERAAALVLRDHGIAPGSFTVLLDCRPDPGDCGRPGSTLTVRVGGSVRLPLLPAVLGSAPRISVRAEQTSPYGRFREAG